MADFQSGREGQHLSSGDVPCDCSEIPWTVVARFDRHAICPRGAQGRRRAADPDLSYLISRACLDEDDYEASDHILRNIRLARTTCVLTSSCGAGKFFGTLLPILDTALKVKNAGPRQGDADAVEGSAFSPIAASPTTLVIEPDSVSGYHTAALLQHLVNEHDLNLEVEDICYDCQPGGRPNGIVGQFAGDVMVCTPSSAMHLVRTGDLSLERVRLVLWNSVDETFTHVLAGVERGSDMQTLRDADELFEACCKFDMGFILAAHSSATDLIEGLESSIPRSGVTRRTVSVEVPVDPAHHLLPASQIQQWERAPVARQHLRQHDVADIEEETPLPADDDHSEDGGVELSSREPPPETTATVSRGGPLAARLHVAEDIGQILDEWEGDCARRSRREIAAPVRPQPLVAHTASHGTQTASVELALGVPPALNVQPLSGVAAPPASGVVAQPSGSIPASQASNRRRASFMSLPVDLRRRILELAVIADGVVPVVTFRTQFNSWPTVRAEIRGPFNNAVEDRRLYCWYPIRKHYQRRLGNRAMRNQYAIALVNRQLAAEARPIIYGRNVFSFDNVSDMNTFVRSLETAWNGSRALSDARNYLQDLRIDSSRG